MSKKRIKPRIICPKCGSVDVVAGTGQCGCRRCGCLFSKVKGLEYPKGTGERRQVERAPMQP